MQLKSPKARHGCNCGRVRFDHPYRRDKETRDCHVAAIVITINFIVMGIETHVISTETEGQLYGTGVRQPDYSKRVFNVFGICIHFNLCFGDDCQNVRDAR